MIPLRQSGEEKKVVISFRAEYNFLNMDMFYRAEYNFLNMDMFLGRIQFFFLTNPE